MYTKKMICFLVFGGVLLFSPNILSDTSKEDECRQRVYYSQDSGECSAEAYNERVQQGDDCARTCMWSCWPNVSYNGNGNRACAGRNGACTNESFENKCIQNCLSSCKVWRNDAMFFEEGDNYSFNETNKQCEQKMEQCQNDTQPEENCPEGQEKNESGECKPIEEENDEEEENEEECPEWENCEKNEENRESWPQTSWTCGENQQWNSAKWECENCTDPWVCCGVKLNTNIPFVWNCIAFNKEGGEGTTSVNQTNAFPKLMGALMNVVMTVSLIIGFVMILFGGVMITTAGIYTENFKKGKMMIIKVGSVLALIGLSGVILKLINPTFFT